MKDKYNDKMSISIDDNNGILADLIDGLKQKETEIKEGES